MKRTQEIFVAPSVPGFTQKKLLAASHCSAVHLAVDERGQRVALKTLRLPTGIDRQTWQRQWMLLQTVTSNAKGLLPILQFGEVAGTDVWFYSLPAADDASDEASGNLTLYNPLTLRLRLKVGGPMPISEVIAVGVHLSTGLERLHCAALVHRDVKPSNIFFVDSMASLGDYDLMVMPQTEATPRGTEGFYPLDEQTTAAADIYALGKTLYEAWTGLDRLEFPSLPPGLAGGKEWTSKGAALNQLLLKACQARPNSRWQNVAAFRTELERLQLPNGVSKSSARWSRNTVGVFTGAAVVAAVLSVVWWPRVVPDQTYDAATQFSATNNPAGVWSYGYSTGRLDAFRLFVDNPESCLFPHSSVLMARWGRDLPFPANHPSIFRNQSPVDLTRQNNLDVDLPRGAVVVHPGESRFPSYAVIRFTCPKDGLYSIEAEFSGVAFSGEGTTTDVHVLIDGLSVFDAEINGFGQERKYVSPKSTRLPTGACIDFVIGPGKNGNSSSDWTGVSARVRFRRP